jgi:hypothetical protein
MTATKIKVELLLMTTAATSSSPTSEELIEYIIVIESMTRWISALLLSLKALFSMLIIYTLLFWIA